MIKPEALVELSNLNDLVNQMEDDAAKDLNNVVSFTKTDIKEFTLDKDKLSLFTKLEWAEKPEDKYKMKICEMILLSIMDTDVDEEGDNSLENSLYTKFLFSQIITYLPSKKVFSMDLLKLIDLLGHAVESQDDLDEEDDEMEGLTVEDLKKKSKNELN